MSKTREPAFELGILQMTPYGYKDEQGLERGALYEIGVLVKQEVSSLSIDVRILPPLRIVKRLGIDSQFCTMAANTPDLKAFDLIEPIGFGLGAGILPKSGVDLTKYEQLQPLAIAVPDSVQFDTKFHNDNSLNKVNAPEYSNAVEMLVHERVDAIAGGIQPILNAAKLRGYDASIFGQPLLMFEAEMYFIYSNALDPQLRSTLKEAVSRLRDSGAISDILNQHF
jgi:ABC-type amino acid transport substrate-binding protein